MLNLKEKMKLIYDLNKSTNQLAKDYMEFKKTHKDSEETNFSDLFE